MGTGQIAGMLERVWLVLGVWGSIAVITGWLPVHEAMTIGVTRAGPILGFLVAVTILAELSDAAGVFDVAAAACARFARGRTPLLFVLVAGLATLVTVGMSLDSTAVLLTPVVLALTSRLGLAPLPFAVLVVWLANTASLLLPVSNLTNLLALQHSQTSTSTFSALMAPSELVAVLVTVCYLGLLFHRSIIGEYEVPDIILPANRITFFTCTVACIGFAVAVAGGVVPWLAATVAVIPVLLAYAFTNRGGIRWSLFPWRLVITTEGLFLIVGAITRHGLGNLLAHLVDGSTSRAVLVAAAASNTVNNLPAYLATETAVPPGATHQLAGVLIGTNCGPLLTMWGSLATLLWAERCRARGVTIRPLQFLAIGLGGVPLVLLGAWAALHI